MNSLYIMGFAHGVVVACFAILVTLRLARRRS